MSWIFNISVVLLEITLTFSANNLERYFTANSVPDGYYTEEALEKHEQFLRVGQDLHYDDFPENPFKDKGNYPCLRHCGRNFKPELCYYQFQIERHQTYSKDCDFNTFSERKYFGDGCITADGTKMRLLTVNKMLPGPALHLCQGDTLVVDVENLLPGGRSVSIHWHGIKHSQSQWMDGVSFLTQCPIGPNQKFRYEFKALEAGTFFYHASDNEQHVGGLAGPLIIRSKEDAERNEWYNEDLYSHTIFIQDLVHEKDDLQFPFTDAKGRFLSPSSYLINGRGQYKEKKRLSFFKHPTSPFAEFIVDDLGNYRFRIIAATNSSCSFRLAIEKHSMLVIAADGNRITPVEVGTIHMHAGERLDVVIKTSQKASSYWIRVKGNDLCSSARQSAVLRYRSFQKKVPSSKSSKTIFTQFSKTLPDLNNFSLGCNNKRQNLCWEHLRPKEDVPEALLKGEVRLIEIKAARTKLVNDNMAQSPVSKEKFDLAFGQDFLYGTETFDQISCQLPPFAILKQFYEHMPANLKCNHLISTIQKCFYVIDLELDEVVDIMFMDATYSDLPKNDKMDRPLSYDRSIHFHGHSVLLLQQGTMEDLEKQRQGLYFSEKTLTSRIFKDTVSIPKDGYIIVRMHASNPGIWALKTPVTDGNGEGVALAFRVGGKNFVRSGIYIPFPSSFPDCNNYVPPVKKLTAPTEEANNAENAPNEQPQEGEHKEEYIEHAEGFDEKSNTDKSQDDREVENGVEGRSPEETLVDTEFTLKPLPLPPGWRTAPNSPVKGELSGGTPKGRHRSFPTTPRPDENQNVLQGRTREFT